jgi:hypothetical protein
VPYDDLDYHLVSNEPVPLYMGELPYDYDEQPARVVLNLCGVHPPGQAFGRIIHTMPLLDVLDDDLAPARHQLERFLEAAHLYAEHEPTYWHCHAGLNRSGLAVAAYLHRYRGLAIGEAIDHLRSTRTPLVLCNGHFERLLRRWYGTADEQAFEPIDVDAYLSARTGGRSDHR